MKGRFLTAEMIAEFREHLILEERSEATVEKYIRDVTAFSAFANGGEISKEMVIAYKKHLQGNYAVRSVNSCTVVNDRLHFSQKNMMKTTLSKTLDVWRSRRRRETSKVGAGYITPR